MDGALQARLNPPAPPTSRDYSDAKVTSQAKAKDAADGVPDNKTSFADLLGNSNEDMARARVAQKNGNGFSAAKTDEEFAQMMADKVNKDNKLRVPQNNLDKDAFLKLFITQMQNQDPLNPDNSSEMASQLAQFHGLEQMMNVNKNLEKMQNENATSRAVGLISFVGKEIKLDNGKLKLENGKLSTGIVSLDGDAVQATLEVRDASGTVVAAQDLGHASKGDKQIAWDARDNKGQKVPDGVYTFNVIAKDVQGQDVPARITSIVKVTGVDLKDMGGSFYTDLGKVRINEVASVGNKDFLAKTQNAQAAVDALKAQAAQDGGVTQAAEAAAAAVAGEQAGAPAGAPTGDGAANKPGSPVIPPEDAEAAAKAGAVPQPAAAPVQAAVDKAPKAPEPEQPTGLPLGVPASHGGTMMEIPVGPRGG